MAGMTRADYFLRVAATANLALTAAYIAHELGWLPHSKDRTSPSDAVYSGRHAATITPTHNFQARGPWAALASRSAHREVYGIANPREALETVMARYRSEPTRSRYTDLVGVANAVSGRAGGDTEITRLIGEIHALMYEIPIAEGQQGAPS